MQITKMSLASIKGKLSRAEMKNIIAGKNDEDSYKCCIGTECTDCVRDGGITCSAAATRIKC